GPIRVSWVSGATPTTMTYQWAGETSLWWYGSMVAITDKNLSAAAAPRTVGNSSNPAALARSGVTSQAAGPSHTTAPTAPPAVVKTSPKSRPYRRSGVNSAGERAARSTGSGNAYVWSGSS